MATEFIAIDLIAAGAQPKPQLPSPEDDTIGSKRFLEASARAPAKAKRRLTDEQRVKMREATNALILTLSDGDPDVYAQDLRDYLCMVESRHKHFSLAKD